MEVTFQLTPDDAYQGMLAWRALRRWRVWLRGCAYVSVALACALSIFLLTFHSEAFPTQSTAWELLGSTALWFAFVVGYPRYCVYRQIKGSPTAQSPTTVNISDEGLEVQNPHANSRALWSAYIDWGERKSVFIVLPQPRMYVTIPKRAFTEEQITAFRELLRSKIVPKK